MLASFFSSLLYLTLVLNQSSAFTLPSASSSSMNCQRTSSSSLSGTRVRMTAVCDVDSPNLVVDRDTTTTAHKIHKHAYLDSSEIDDEYEYDKWWTLKLFNDSINTRSYICCSLVKVAGLSETDSYQRMMQAHKHGESVIGEYCQEHAEHYKEALISSGLVCEIFPVEE